MILADGQCWEQFVMQLFGACFLLYTGTFRRTDVPIHRVVQTCKPWVKACKIISISIVNAFLEKTTKAMLTIRSRI
jgi:hypothetical protein